MNMMKFLRGRRTYRRFEQRPVAPEILTEAVDAARIASCGANRQTVRYIIVESADAVASVQPLVHWAAYLPPEQGCAEARRAAHRVHRNFAGRQPARRKRCGRRPCLWAA